MGQMTVVSLLNDGWDTIKEHPDQFIENIDKAITEQYDPVRDYRIHNFANPMEVSASFSADVQQLFFMGHNTMTNLTTTAYATEEDKEFQLKRIKEARKLLDIYEKLIKENK